MRRIPIWLFTRVDAIAVVLGACIIVAVAFTVSPVAGWAALGTALIALGVIGR